MTIIGTMIPIAISTVMSGLSTGKPTTQKKTHEFLMVVKKDP